MTCPGCGFSYTNSDHREHEIHHQRWEDASARHGVIRASAQRENDKLEAWAILEKTDSMDQATSAVVEVVRSHFERSVSQAGFGNWASHPPFEQYAAAYENSSLKKHALAWAAFRRLYPSRPSTHLAPDFTYWEE